MKKNIVICLMVFALGMICFSPIVEADIKTNTTKSVQLSKKRNANANKQLGKDTNTERNKHIAEQLGNSVSKGPTQTSQSKQNPNGRSKVDFQKTEKVIIEVPEYYANYVKQDGWFKGINKLNSLDDARKRGCYYKFSRKNKAGNWTLVEAFDGYDKPTPPEDYETYLVDPYDEYDYSVNSEWKKRLQQVCKWSFLTDGSGKTVVQEIAMNAIGDTIFVFTPIKVGEREFVGSYSDSRGVPVYLRSDEDGGHENYASQILVIRDGNGYDEYIKYIDDYGFPQKNKDGVYMIHNKYDSVSRHISLTSFDFNGVRMNNLHNYCEWKRQYQNNSYNQYFFDADSIPANNTIYGIKSLKFNKNGSPKRFGLNSIGKVSGFCIYFDKLGRDTTVELIDTIGKPFVNDYGVHKIHKKYNDYGQVTYCASYDSIGNLCAKDYTGVSQIIYHYQDSDPADNSIKHVTQRNKKTTKKNHAIAKKNNHPARRFVIKEYLDKDSNYVIGDGGYCKQVLEYKNDSLVCQTNYKPKEKHNSTPKKRHNSTSIKLGKLSSDSLVISFLYKIDEKGDTIRKWYINGNKGYQRIDSVDSYQRHTLTAWYDLEWHPINDVDSVMLIDNDDSYLYDKEYSSSIIDYKKEYHGFHKKTIKYDDKNGIMTIQLFNKDGGPAYDIDNNNCYYTKVVTKRDRINGTDTAYYYTDTRLTHIFVSQEDPRTDLHIQQFELTPYGERTRNYEDNLTSYMLNGLYDIRGNQLAVYGQNEFGEPSYTNLYMGYEDFVFYLMDLQRNRYYDDELTEYSYSEMADLIKRLPRAFCIEMTDTTTVAYQCGLRNGDIIVSFGDWIVSKDLRRNLNEFYLETILKADTTKTIKLLRHHPDKKSSEIVSCELPKGKISDLGFYPQKIYYTQKEANRLEETCETYNIPLSYSFNNGDTTILLAVQRKGSRESTPLYYNSTNKDAGILLYAESNDDIWSVRKTIPIDNKTGEIQFSPDYIYLTHDLNDLTLISEYDHHGGLEIVPIKVNKSLYERILDFYDIHSKQIPFDYCLVVYRTKKDPAIIDNKLRGKWNMVAKLGYFMTVDMTVKLNKGNRAELDIRLVKESSYARVEYAYRATPKWTLNGVCIEFDFSNANAECEITQLDYDSDVSWIKNAAENIRHKLIEDINTIPLFIENCLIVNGLSKDDMTVTDGNKEYVFKKVK